MYPRLSIDLDRIRSNTSTLLDLVGKRDIFGVTKGVAGSIQVAGAMIDSGVEGLADSRLLNLIRLNEEFEIPLMLLRQPMINEIESAIKVADFIFVTEIELAKKLSLEAARVGKVQNIILMLEAGDLREGITPFELDEIAFTVQKLDSIELHGLAINTSCSFSIAPTKEQLVDLVEAKKELVKRFDKDIPILSGGNSSCINLLLSGDMPKEINQLRVGEAILFGHEPIEYKPLKGFRQGAFSLEAEIIEIKRKSSDQPRRAVVAVGRQDIAMAPIKTVGGTILNRSSDHLTIKMEDEVRLRVGDTVKIEPSYFAVLAAMTSPYVDKEYIGL